MDLYDLRHFCGSWLLNDVELPQKDVAHQLGHSDGGALVIRLYGHPSERLARERIKRAAGAKPAPIASISEPNRSQQTV
jgi:integrase